MFQAIRVLSVWDSLVWDRLLPWKINPVLRKKARWFICFVQREKTFKLKRTAVWAVITQQTAITISESDSAPCGCHAHCRCGTTTGIMLITIRERVSQRKIKSLSCCLSWCFLIVIGQTTRLWRHAGVHRRGDTNNTYFSVSFFRGVVITNKR